MCARNRGPHVLLAKHVIEELRDLGGQEIAWPLGGDRLQRLDRAQIVVAMPERERPMERALARVHRERVARTQVDSRVLKGAVGLAVEPERRGVELNDRSHGPALCGTENGLDALIETQQPRGEVVRRRDGSSVIAGHIEAAGVLHRTTLSVRRVARQSGSAGSCQCPHADRVGSDSNANGPRPSGVRRSQSTAGPRDS